MLNTLKSLLSDLSGHPAPRFGPRDQRVAAAVLLTHLVGVDGEVNAIEKTRLHEALKDRFGLDDDGARDLVQAALESEREAIDFEEFTTLLTRTLDERGRRELVAMMWDMARADGRVTELEESAIWRVARLLGVLDPKAFAAEALRRPEDT